MPASIFSETELARLAGFPEEIPSDDLIRAFTLTGVDRDLVAIRRGAVNRLGLALQLCALRYLGFVPRNLSAAPRSAACFVADQLEISPDEMQSYARREQTRRQHFSEVREHLGFSMLRSGLVAYARRPRRRWQHAARAARPRRGHWRHRRANTMRVCSPASRRLAPLRPRGARLSALTPAPRTFVQIGPCRRCPLAPTPPPPVGRRRKRPRRKAEPAPHTDAHPGEPDPGMC